MMFDNTKIEFSIFDLKRNIKLPNKLNQNLAELVGIMVGDGCIYVKKDEAKRIKYELFISGHAIDDLEYHEKTISNLFNNLFNIKPYIRRIYGTKGIRTCITSKAIINFLIRSIKLKSGNKIYNKNNIPSYFLYIKDNKVIYSLIRGIADTDFCLKFKRKYVKYNRYHYYPIIVGNFGSSILTKRISVLLNRINIKNHLEFSKNSVRNKKFNCYSVVISGKKNLEKWMRTIGFNNIKHKTKYIIWKKFGFCPPKTSLEDRRKILKGKLNLYSLYGHVAKSGKAIDFDGTSRKS